METEKLHQFVTKFNLWRSAFGKKDWWLILIVAEVTTILVMAVIIITTPEKLAGTQRSKPITQGH